MIFIRDITGRKAYEEQLEHLSTHDVLTGLYNRTFYETELNRLATSRRYPVSIIVVDMDGLKQTNDTYGHAAGDKMICKAATIMKGAFRADDLVARTGGDEFTVLLPETDKAGLAAAVERIEKSLAEANRIEDGYYVKLSIGTAIAESNEKLLGAEKAADLAMYRNKAANKSS
jgi:diguanylate cyclase (GGDEF)-like protein